MKIEEIKKCIEDYVNNPDTDYAVAINGEWGSGKTFLWDYELIDIVRNNKKKAIYISLSSQSNIEELRKMTYARIATGTQRNKQNVRKNAIKYISIVTDFITEYGAKIPILSHVTDWVFSAFRSLLLAISSLYMEHKKLNKYVLCFDDFERCEVSMMQVLGFLSELIEQKGAKVVILMDERQIKGEEREKVYKTQKEKVIRWTFDFNNDLESVFDTLTKKYEYVNIDFKQYMEQHKNYIISLLKKYDHNNVRTVNFILDAIYGCFPIINTLEKEHFEKIIFFVAIIAIEYKKGNLSTSHFNNYNGIDRINRLEIEGIKNKQSGTSNIYVTEEFKQRDEYKVYFYDIYLSELKEFVFFPSVFVFIISGHLDIMLFKNEVSAKLLREVESHLKVLNDIYNIYDQPLSAEEFEFSFKQCVQYLKSGKYSIEELIKCSVAVELLSRRQLILESISAINETFEEGLLAIRSKTPNEFLEHMSYLPETDEITRYVRDRFIEIKKDYEKHLEEQKASAFIDCIKDADDKFIVDNFAELVKWKEFINYVHVDLIADILCNAADDTSIIAFRKFVRWRYSDTNLFSVFLDENNYLLELYSKLSTAIKGMIHLSPIRNFYFQTLLEEISSALLKRYNIDVTKEENPDSRIVE